MTNLPIDKQVEEAFACTDNCRADFRDLDCHWSSCAAYHRPAVLALLGRREQERQERIRNAFHQLGKVGDCQCPVCRKDFNVLLECYFELDLKHMALERREREHAAEVKRLRDAWEHEATVEEIDFHVAQDRLARGETIITTTTVGPYKSALRKRIAELEALIHPPEQPELGPCGRHGKELWKPMRTVDCMSGDGPEYGCTACAQEKAAPGGVSSVES